MRTAGVSRLFEAWCPARIGVRRKMIDTLAIAGLGLMGGSLGLAVKESGSAGRVIGWGRREESRRMALDKGCIDEACESLEDTVAECDLAVLCVPVMTMPELASVCIPRMKKGSVLTDVGSTKTFLNDEISKVLGRCPVAYVGSHPIAGSERAGIEASSKGLYRGAIVVVVDPPTGVGASAEAALLSVRNLWESVGGLVVRMSAEKHDRIIAGTSHLPHLVASMLMASVFREGSDADSALLCGTGFRDSTRIAAGSEIMWHDIVKSNSPAISRELAEFERVLAEVRAAVDAGEFEKLKQFLAEARVKRTGLDADRSVENGNSD